ncbi:MAG: tRNA (adenosine(37)-N6)-dimethylallyltransferase MiaA [Bacteroidales bacterium]|nr:tRNA (adenosine(37)-N6)-dimethylallyltransferase MiaA [Bacteroidales bacterium]
MKSGKQRLIVITGPTASGKTRLAAHLASMTDGEVISADSRQVYRGMDIGTGKDLQDFSVNDTTIPYHLIDILSPGEEYNVYAFQQDFVQAFKDITARGKTPILCGGTGLYIEAATLGYRLLKVPDNKVLRKELEQQDMHSLVNKLRSLKTLHNITDITDKARLIRALEIAVYEKEHQDRKMDFPEFDARIFAISVERNLLRRRITERLKKRLQEGMINEVEQLLKNGIAAERLLFYGLEYRYLTLYILGELTYEEMFSKLNTAIHQFAKRQMTWFRRMEHKGLKIIWIDGNLPVDEQCGLVLAKI